MKKTHFICMFILFFFQSITSLHANETPPPFSILHWEKIALFKEKSIKEKITILHDLCQKKEKGLHKENNATLSKEIEVLFYYFETDITNSSDIAANKNSLNTLLTRCYASLLQNKSSNDIKQALIEAIASLALSLELSNNDLIILVSIQSRWKKLLFSIIAHDIICKYDTCILEQKALNEFIIAKKESSTKEYLTALVATYISHEKFDALDSKVKQKLNQYIKQRKYSKEKNNLILNFKQLQEKAYQEISTLWDNLYPIATTLSGNIKEDLLTNNKETPAYLISLYLISRQGKIDKSDYIKSFEHAIKYGIKEIENTHTSVKPFINSSLSNDHPTNKMPFIEINDIEVALHCASQIPSTVDDPSAMVCYFMNQAAILPKLNRTIKRIQGFNNTSNFTLHKQQQLGNTLSFFKHQDIPNRTLNLDDKEPLTHILGIIFLSNNAFDYLNVNKEGKKSIALALYPNEPLILTNNNPLPPLKELFLYLTDEWLIFYNKSSAFKAIIDNNMCSEDAIEKLLNQNLQAIYHFSIAAIIQYRLTKKTQTSNKKTLGKITAIPNFDNGFAPLGRLAGNLVKCLSLDLDTSIMTWDEEKIHKFEINSKLNLQNYKFSSQNYIDVKEITREKESFQPIELIPSPDSFIDDSESLKNYATLLLVILRKTELALNKENSITKEQKEKYITLLHKKANKILSKNNTILTTPLSIAIDALYATTPIIEKEKNDKIKKELHELYQGVKKRIANSIDKSTDELKNFNPSFSVEIVEELKQHSPSLLLFYNLFKKSLMDVSNSSAFNLRVRHTPIFLDLSIMICSFPKIEGHDQDTLSFPKQTSIQIITDTYNDNEATALAEKSVTRSRIPLCLAYDFINTLSAQVARNITIGDKKNAPTDLSHKEKELLSLSYEKEYLDAIPAIIYQSTSSLQLKGDVIEQLRKHLSKLDKKDPLYQPILRATQEIPDTLNTQDITAIFKKGYKIANDASTYLNIAILTTMIYNGISQLQLGQYQQFIQSQSDKLFALIPRLKDLIPTNAMINSGIASSEYINQLNESITDLNQIGEDLRGFGYHNAGTPQEFIMTPGSTPDGWIPVNIFTTVYVSVLGMLSVANGIFTQNQTFQKLTESEYLSLINGKLDISTIEQLIHDAAIPENNDEALYTPTTGDTLKDMASGLIQFNAHIKRGLRHALSYCTSNNGIKVRMLGSLIDYMLLPISVTMSHVNQSVHARLHTYKSLTDFTKDAQVDRMLYSFMKLAFFDTVKPFIDTRIADTVNLIVGMGILAADFPVATLAKSSLTRSLQVQIQHRAHYDALRDYWEHNGESVNGVSHQVLGKLYGNAPNSLKASIQSVRDIEKAQCCYGDYDTQRARLYSTLGLACKTLHGANYCYNLATYVYSPISAVMNGSADIVTDKLANSLAKQPGPHSGADKAVHSINLLRKSYDMYFNGWQSPVSVKFISTGVGKVADNLSMISNVHATMATYSRRATNHVVVADGIFGSFKDAVTGALNRLAISSNDKSFQTITGAVDQVDTPIKEAATSYAQHRNLTMLPPALTEYTETAITKKVTHALRSNTPLAEMLEQQSSVISASLTDLGYEGALAISQVIKDHIDISNLNARSTKEKKDFTGVSDAIRFIKHKLAKDTNGFMEAPAAIEKDQQSSHMASSAEHTVAIKKSSNRLAIYVEELSNLLENSKPKTSKRFEILKIYTLMAQEKDYFLEFLKAQQPLNTIHGT